MRSDWLQIGFGVKGPLCDSWEQPEAARTVSDMETRCDPVRELVGLSYCCCPFESFSAPKLKKKFSSGELLTLGRVLDGQRVSEHTGSTQQVLFDIQMRTFVGYVVFSNVHQVMLSPCKVFAATIICSGNQTIRSMNTVSLAKVS